MTKTMTKNKIQNRSFSLYERNYRYGLLMRYIDTWARISSRKLLNCTHCIVEFECVSAQLYLVDDSQLQWRENISEKWTKKTSRIVKKCSIHECIFWFVPSSAAQGKDFDKSNQTSAEICKILIKKYNVQKGYCLFFPLLKKTSSKIG